ncbi:unnamed protein product [Danaus chrysippus]|uniref:(African queen) hypothetical protein n=1 Tax=Danaus chrysippus TaxID=151541 RepID=A0A8J2WF50_9NEOP|nr:unnamed protein product [Danaus chrysippus]
MVDAGRWAVHRPQENVGADVAPAAAKLLTFRTNDTNKILARILVVECYSVDINATTVSNKFNRMAESCQLIRKAERTGKVVGHVGGWRQNMSRAANDTLTYDIISRFH